jgi:release factor glutamine methyltransferase
VTGLAIVPGTSALALLAEGAAALTAAGLPTARLDAERLLAGMAGVDRFQLHVADRDLGADFVTRYRAGIARRAGHEPLQHILGWEEFCGLRLAVGPAVLVPRLETEALVEWALELLPDGGTVCDAGTGSGCIATALAAARPDVRVIGVDHSLPALAVAAANVRALGLAERVALVAGDLFAPFRRHRRVFDLVVANLPYLPSSIIAGLPAEVRDWEPRHALDGGADGTAVLRDVISGAAEHLSPDGWLVMEIGEEQAPPLAALMASHGFCDVQVRRDLAGVERYLAGRTERAAADMRPAAQAPLGARLNSRRSSAGRIARRSRRRAELRFRESAKRARATFLGGGSEGGESPPPTF